MLMMGDAMMASRLKDFSTAGSVLGPARTIHRCHDATLACWSSEWNMREREMSATKASQNQAQGLRTVFSLTAFKIAPEPQICPKFVLAVVFEGSSQAD